MNTKIKFRMLMTAMALVFTTAAFAQQTRSYGALTSHYIQGYEIIVTYEATFEGFATQLQIHDTKLYVVSGPESFETAAENAGLSKVSIPNSAYKSGYPIDRFTVYMQGDAVLSEGGYSKKFTAPFKVQLSNGLGDFTTPEFSQEAKDYYKNKKDIWEEHGSLRAGDVEVTQVVLDDFDIRLKK